jgi:hypothetical protein
MVMVASVSDTAKSLCGCGAHHSTPLWMWLFVAASVVAAALAAHFIRPLVRARGFGTRGHRSASQRANIALVVIVGVVCAAVGLRLMLVAALGVAAVLGRASTLGAREHEARSSSSTRAS